MKLITKTQFNNGLKSIQNHPHLVENLVKFAAAQAVGKGQNLDPIIRLHSAHKTAKGYSKHWPIVQRYFFTAVAGVLAPSDKNSHWSFTAAGKARLKDNAFSVSFEEFSTEVKAKKASANKEDAAAKKSAALSVATKAAADVNAAAAAAKSDRKTALTEAAAVERIAALINELLTVGVILDDVQKGALLNTAVQGLQKAAAKAIANAPTLPAVDVAAAEKVASVKPSAKSRAAKKVAAKA